MMLKSISALKGGFSSEACQKKKKSIILEVQALAANYNLMLDDARQFSLEESF
ncbi:hypothetical protein MANES_06G078066v8 [Manihot esculenta]|uniref:Uncharacterized protein n=1 Tax=Manihot esculenta TaxID=3983 RepID=A0ACB7HJI7_MANES|nr:hypothetical protein MANES_06G078066v8 [Manihot esculenta]